MLHHDLNEHNFQKVINSQEEWEEMLFSDGLTVIDVCDRWCYMCKPISKLMWKVCTTLNNKHLHFAIAVTNNIDSLDRYRNRSEPCFLLYAGALLIDVVRGANGPLLLKIVHQRIEEEELVYEGLYDRIEITDPYFKELQNMQEEEELAKEYEEDNVEVVLLVLKPEFLKKHKIDEVRDKLLEVEEIKIVLEEEKHFTYDEALVLCAAGIESDFYEILANDLTLATAYVFVLSMSPGSIIDELIKIIGPESLEEAKEFYPECLRTLYERPFEDDLFHFAKDKESCEKEILTVYPDYEFEKTKVKKTDVTYIQRTVAIIRPTAIANAFKEAIIKAILDNGFEIIFEKDVTMSREEWEKFYESESGDTYFEDLLGEMLEGPSVALCIQRKDAVRKWNSLLGNANIAFAKKYQPASLRSMYSDDSVFVNLIHGSKTLARAFQEVKVFFPIVQTVAIIKPDVLDAKDEIIELILEAGFLISASKEMKLTAADVKAIYGDHSRKPYYNALETYMTRGPCLVLVLSKQNVIEEFRKIVGATDPEVAAETNPDSLRALYGMNMLENGIYGSKTANEVTTVLETCFGEIYFDDDGHTVKDEEEDEEAIYMKEADELVDDILKESEIIVFKEKNKEVETPASKIKFSKK